MAEVGTQSAPKPPSNRTTGKKKAPAPPPRRNARNVQFKENTSTPAGTTTEKERGTKAKMTDSATQTRATGPRREEPSERKREDSRAGRHDREDSGHQRREEPTDRDREHHRGRGGTQERDLRDSDTESRDRHKDKEDNRSLLEKVLNRPGKESEKSETDKPTTRDRSRSSRYKQSRRGRGENASPSHRTTSEKEAAANAARERAAEVHDSADEDGTDRGTRSSRKPRETGHRRDHDSNASTRRDQDGHRRDESPHSTRRGHDSSTARRRQSADSAAESRGPHPSHKSDKSRRVSRVLHEQYSYNMDVEFDPRQFAYGEKCSCCDQEKPFLKIPVPPDVIRSLWEDGLFD